MTVASPRDALALNAAALTSVMVRVTDTPQQFAEMLNDKRLNACVIGPGAGIGARTQEFVLAALKAQRSVLLDADALTSFADDPNALFAAIKKQPTSVVLTPHDGEFRRLFGDLDAKESKLQRASRRRCEIWRSCRVERRRHRRYFTRWTRIYRRQRTALVGDRRLRRCAGWNDRRHAGAACAGVRGRVHRRVGCMVAKWDTRSVPD